MYLKVLLLFPEILHFINKIKQLLSEFEKKRTINQLLLPAISFTRLNKG